LCSDAYLHIKVLVQTDFREWIDFAAVNVDSNIFAFIQIKNDKQKAGKKHNEFASFILAGEAILSFT